VKRTDPLNTRQLQVLHWISEGCPDGVMDGDGHKTSARALHHRRLVRVSRKDGRWHASLMSDGEYYLQHGQHRPASAPDLKPVRQVRATIAKVDTARAPAERVPRAAKKRSPYQGKTEELIAQLLAAGGEIHVDEDDNRNIPGLVTYANRRDKVPSGMRMVQRRFAGGYDVRLEQLPDWVTATFTPIAIPDAVRRPHPVIETLRAKDSALFVTGPARVRAVRLLHALVSAAVERGYTVKDNMPKNTYGYRERAGQKGQLTISIHGHPVGVGVRQEDDRTPHVPTARELRQQDTDSWFRMPKWDKSPSERLVLTLDALHQTRQGSWKDGATTSLDDVLAEVLQEIELRCAAAVSAEAERVAERERRRVRWEAAMAQARREHEHHVRAELLRRQAADWRSAQELKDYLEAMTAHTRQLPQDQAAGASEWLAFAENHLARLNPLTRSLTVPVVPDASPRELEPFLHGWSPYGPQ
jgi:hypothetical protein